MDIPDGTQIVSDTGLRGRVTNHVQAADGTACVLVTYDDGTAVRIPTAWLVMQPNGSASVTRNQDAHMQGSATQADGEIVIPILAEDLHVATRAVETGRVRVRKVVHERDELVDEPLLREEIDITRVAINRQVATAPAVRREGDTLIVPVVEEVLVVEKRLILKEELHITRRQTTAHDPQTVTLRQEELIVEQLPPAAAHDERQQPPSAQRSKTPHIG